jgi:hypothetical protein
MKERNVLAAAVWGELRAIGQKVAICASSGSTNVSGWSQTPYHIRIRYDGDRNDGQNLTADQIIEWDTDTETLRRITIPNTRLVSQLSSKVFWRALTYFYIARSRVFLY